MKLQPASKKEVKRMAVGCSICAVIEIIGFFILSQFGIGKFGYQVITGSIGGTLVSVLNFAMMCLMIQSAAGIQDQKLLKARVQGSYNLRLFVQAVWVVVAFVSPWFNVIAAAVPLFFPTAVIYYLQSKGKLMPPSNPNAPKREPVQEPEEDHLDTFEA